MTQIIELTSPPPFIFLACASQIKSKACLQQPSFLLFSATRKWYDPRLQSEGVCTHCTSRLEKSSLDGCIHTLTQQIRCQFHLHMSISPSLAQFFFFLSLFSEHFQMIFQWFHYCQTDNSGSLIYSGLSPVVPLWSNRYSGTLMADHCYMRPSLFWDPVSLHFVVTFSLLAS